MCGDWLCLVILISIFDPDGALMFAGSSIGALLGKFVLPLFDIIMSALLCFILPNFGNPIFVNNVGWLVRFCPAYSYPIIIHILAFRQASNAGIAFVIMLLFVAMPRVLCLHLARLLFASHGGLSGCNVCSSGAMCLNVDMCVPLCPVGQQ